MRQQILLKMVSCAMQTAKWACASECSSARIMYLICRISAQSSGRRILCTGAMASRAKNTASVSEISRLLKATIGVEVVQSWLDSKTFEAAEVAEKFELAICDVLKWTPRPTKKLFQHAFQEAFKITSSESMAIGQAVFSTITHARNTAKSVTSGVKTVPSIRNIIAVLKGGKQEDSERKSISRPSSSSAPVSSGMKRKASSHDIMEISSVERLSDGETPIKPTEQRLKESMRSFGICSPVKVACWIDWAECLVKRRRGSDIEVAVLEPGPAGYVLARFEDSQVTTEMPNLFLKHNTGKQPPGSKSSAKVSKKPAAGVFSLKKKPASAEPLPAPASEGVLADEEAGSASLEGRPVSKILRVMKTCASKQSYVQAVLSDKKKKLLVSVPESMSKNHANIVGQLFSLAEGKCASKDFDALKVELLAERAKLLV